jgi:hypothetical protein
MSNNANSKSSGGYVPRSNSSYIKGFMHSYGLKPWNDDDVQEGKQIIEKFKELDRMQWEEEQANGQAQRK